MTATRAGSAVGVMSPKPTVEKTVTVKYSALTLVSGCENAPGSDRASVKYVHANTTRKIGMTSARASAARRIGRADLMTARTSNVSAATKQASPTDSRSRIPPCGSLLIGMTKYKTSTSRLVAMARKPVRTMCRRSTSSHPGSDMSIYRSGCVRTARPPANRRPGQLVNLSAQRFRLRLLELRVADHALGAQIGEPGDFLRGATAP